MKRVFALVSSLFLLQLIAALICGPHSCEWGNEFYFGFGLFTLITVLLMMLLLNKDWELIKKLVYAAIFAFVSIAIWMAGLVLGEFNILCRLF